MVEQRLSGRPIEGILELYVAEKKPSGEEYLVVSETTIGLKLAELYKEYSTTGVSRIDELLDKAYTELLESLRKYRDLLEELTSGYSTLGVIKTVVKDFTGCESHEDFTDTVLQAVKVLLGREVTNPARALVELFNEYHNAAMTLNNQYPVIVVLDPNVEEGYLGVLGLSAGGKIRYAIPFVIIKYVSGQGELRQYLGIEALKWLVEYKREGRILVALRALNIEPRKSRRICL